MIVPFFDYTRIYEYEKSQVRESIEDVLSRSDFILRDDVFKFEDALASYANANFVVGVANGTDAIWLAMIALGIGKNDEVILPSHTYIATADAIMAVGAIPVLVDCNREDHLISTEAIRDAISSRTKAVIPVNLNGRVSRMDEILSIARDYNLYVIEDSAQGMGATLLGKSAGTFGDAGTQSFFPAKNLGCYGDGGAVFVKDINVANKLRELRNHGRNDNGEVVSWGFNSRLDNLQAAILQAKLLNFDYTVRRRRELAKIYCDNLKNVTQIQLPPPPKVDDEHFDSFQNFEIVCQSRQELRDYLREQKIGTSLPWAGKAVHQFGLSGCLVKNLDVTDELFRGIMLLPLNQYMTDNEAYFVVEKIKHFYGE